MRLHGWSNFSVCVVGTWSLIACSSPTADGDTQPKLSEPDLAYRDWGEPFAELPSGEAQRQRVCSSGVRDLVHEVFCADEPAHIESLTDLERALHLDPETLGGLSGSALTGHSTSLSLRSVSAINPRVILFRHVLMQACSLCHNERLDQSVSRARFRADLRGMSRAEKDRAIERLMPPANDVRAMPPARLRALTPEARANAIATLRKE